MNYSQSNIEEVVNKIYPNHKGYFVEVGCWDGEIISQTKKFEEQGWRGLCIDPFPHGDWSKRTCELVKIAIGTKWEFRPFTKVTIDRRNGGDVSYFSGFSDMIKEHLPLIMEHCDFTVEYITCMALQKILDARKSPKFIEFLSVDVEGAEMDVFNSIDWDVQRFGIITFEHNDNQERRSEISEFLVSKGYKLYAEFRIDDVFVSEALEL